MLGIYRARKNSPLTKTRSFEKYIIEYKPFNYLSKIESDLSLDNGYKWMDVFILWS